MEPYTFSCVIAHPGQFHVYHLRRSGGHGVIDWLLAHHDGNKCHHNQGYPEHGGWISVIEGQTYSMPGDIDKPLFELISFEDVPIDMIARRLAPPSQAVLMLRDPFNMFASRLKMIRNNAAADECGHSEANRIDPEIWKQYAREFLNPRYLPYAVRLNFNAWYVSADYRQNIAAQLGWDFTDNGFGSTAGWRFSRGSSFGETDPKHLDLFRRWEVYRDDEEFLSYFDEETRELSQQIFHFVPPLRAVGRSPQTSPPGAARFDRPSDSFDRLDSSLS